MSGLSSAAKVRAALTTSLFLTLVLIFVPLLTGWRTVSFADPVLRAAANAMLDVLEKRFERAQVSDWSGIRGVIVLGGQPDRYREAYRLAAAHPHLAIVISGPS